jgi:hypothetical protein
MRSFVGETGLNTVSLYEPTLKKFAIILDSFDESTAKARSRSEFRRGQGAKWHGLPKNNKGEDCWFFTFLYRKYHLFLRAAEAAIYG